MLLHIGNETIVNSKNIIGLFDLEKTSVKKDVKKFLKNATKKETIVNVSYEMPKTFILCCENDCETIYVTALSVNTLIRRLKVGGVF